MHCASIRRIKHSFLRQASLVQELAVVTLQTLVRGWLMRTRAQHGRPRPKSGLASSLVVVTAMAIHPNRQLIACSCSSGMVQIFQRKTGQVDSYFQVCLPWVSRSSPSSCSSSGRHRRSRSGSGDGDAVQSLAFSPSGAMLGVVTSSGASAVLHSHFGYTKGSCLFAEGRDQEGGKTKPEDRSPFRVPTKQWVRFVEVPPYFLLLPTFLPSPLP